VCSQWRPTIPHWHGAGTGAHGEHANLRPGACSPVLPSGSQRCPPQPLAHGVTDSGKALAEQVKQLWCALAEETVTGLPAQNVAELPGILRTMTGNVDTRRPGRPHDRRQGPVADATGPAR
jgi:hypothetical protein